jgi:hypothetical protein
MRSWSTLQPGERFSCVGCHEPKSEVSPSLGHVPQALRRGPRPLEPFYGPARGFSFPREIQPILDKHCIRCHRGRGKVPRVLTPAPRGTPATRPARIRTTVSHRHGKDAPARRAFSLLGTPNVDSGSKRLWSDAYLALTRNGTPNRIVQWLNVQSIPPMLPPYYAGSAKSGLITMLLDGHNNVKLSREEMEKLCCWIDLLVPYCGDYTEANAWNDREKEKYARYLTKRRQMEALERESITALLEAQAGRRGRPQDTPMP